MNEQSPLYFLLMNISWYIYIYIFVVFEAYSVIKLILWKDDDLLHLFVFLAFRFADKGEDIGGCSWKYMPPIASAISRVYLCMVFSIRILPPYSDNNVTFLILTKYKLLFCSNKSWDLHSSLNMSFFSFNISVRVYTRIISYYN